MPPIPRPAAVPAAAVLLALLSLPSAAGAQSGPVLRPGLWEHKVAFTSQSGQMEAAMAQMQRSMAALPPEQRRMMEDMMARQGVGVGADGQSVKICLSAEDAAGQRLPVQEGCSQQVQRQGEVWTVAFQCKGPPPSSGQGTVRRLGPTAYEGDVEVLTEVASKPERVRMKQTGRWLSADCGKVRPAPR
ncbi:DUF3617 domain-containing protein [Piscinibacter sakaiensis]|nr:DUF3617 domain-containing protein [Piscinibacter sakaiensis]